MRWLGIFDDGCMMCEYVFIDAETDAIAKSKLKAYLSGRGIPAPDAYLGIIDATKLTSI